MSEVAKHRIAKARKMMEMHGISFLLIPDSDPHCSEYTAPHFALREYLSGFTGSNGTLLIGKEEAWLWTDGRYFLQAKEELSGSGITMMKEQTEGCPDLNTLLANRLSPGDILAFDPRLLSGRKGHALEKLVEKRGAKLKTDLDPAEALWPEREPLPCHPVYALGEELTGLSLSEKLNLLEKEVRKRGCKGYLTAMLDCVMWLLNLRGGDVECSPVALSFFLLRLSEQGREALLFIQKKELSPELAEKLEKEGVTLKEYGEIYSLLQEEPVQGKVLCDLSGINYALLKRLEQGDFLYAPDPVKRAKAVKNETELSVIRKNYLLDSVAVVRFMYWVKHRREGLTELSAAEKMDSLRAELPGFAGLSFPTISAYGEHGAVVHYGVTPESSLPCKEEGMLLVDSGGQYPGTTTDITRTYILGPVPGEWKKHYTLVLAGCLRLGHLKFPKGVMGYNLDLAARAPLWAEGLNYLHGTGHGIGAMLNVHEGPPGIRMKALRDEPEEPLRAGEIISDEPGVYIEGSHGIRLENICEIIEDEASSQGEFLRMSFLTWVPFDRDGIDPEWLSEEDLRLLNEYHSKVYDKIAPHLNQEEREWLRTATLPIKCHS